MIPEIKQGPPSEEPKTVSLCEDMKNHKHDESSYQKMMSVQNSVDNDLPKRD